MPPTPAKRLAVLACMDTRLNPAVLLGLEDGDAHVIRNAGGFVSDDVIRSLTLSQGLGTEEVVVIQHTDCGALGPDADLEESVRRSLAQIRASDEIPRTGQVRGFVYDVYSGDLREVGG